MINTILFLAANPTATSRLRLDTEAREIEEKLRASEHRDLFRLRTRWATTPDDLLQALNEDRPTVVHFSGHGANEGIVLDDGEGGTSLVPGAALLHLFSIFRGEIKVVLLNACFSEQQAKSIVKVIDCVVGMNASVGDRAAASYAASFYRALGFGRSVQNAHEQGLAAIALGAIGYYEAPQLLVRDTIDPAVLRLVDDTNQYAAQNASKTLLWIDDDGLQRFHFEAYQLQENGWNSEFAISVVDAARALATKDFNTIILDLILPFARGIIEPNQGAWGGCAVLYWLYGRPLPREIESSPSLRTLKAIAPRPANRDAILIIVTAFVSNEILALVDAVAPRHVSVLFKPVEMTRLLGEIANA